ncbi:MAG TPA: ABC transporter ATP-binding protein [Verrucomicrobiae bacterium]|nr:ABC transporter ATP-binding protein [Verrucomicrobiae bacterium]
MEIIAIKDLHKNFGKAKALNGLELSVKQGEIHGFLGPNGAGKSTTIRILLGLLRKTRGTVSLFGRDPWREATELHRRLAYVPGDVNLWPNLSGGEAIDLLGTLRGNFNTMRRNELIERFKLDPTKKCNAYSKGNRQKVAIISALASDVDLYILDEPTSGLDPLMQSIFNEEMAKLKQQGKTVLLSSHVLAEVEALCDQITIIKEGRTVEAGTLNELRQLTRTTVEVRTEQPISKLETIPGAFDIEQRGTHARLKVEPASLDEVMRHLAKFTITSLTATPPTLEELFLKHYGEGSEDN